MERIRPFGVFFIAVLASIRFIAVLANCWFNEVLARYRFKGFSHTHKISHKKSHKN
tara:strand:- start:1063 stop:1230 length:168 start_codon:yes stop_codon:yes gene_type:complete